MGEKQKKLKTGFAELDALLSEEGPVRGDMHTIVCMAPKRSVPWASSEGMTPPEPDKQNTP